jgi:hypothetical protein
MKTLPEFGNILSANLFFEQSPYFYRTRSISRWEARSPQSRSREINIEAPALR